MKNLILITCVVLLAAIVLNAQQTEFPKLTGPYLGQKPPGEKAELFGNGILSTGMPELNSVFFPGGIGNSDIYRAELVDGRYVKAECLPEPVNSRGFEGDALIAPDESYIIVSVSRGSQRTGTDLFISFRTAEGKWTDLVNMGPDINGPGGENCQMLSPCGKYLFFTGRRYNPEKAPVTYAGLKARHNGSLNGLGDSFWVDAGVIEKFRPGAAAANTSSSAPAEQDVFALLQAFDTAAKRPLWPGFNAAEMPLALFDGEKTILLRHPSPPPEFSPLPDRPGILVFNGQYPAVVSNSTRQIGGVRTGTLVAKPGSDPVVNLLACIEEVFHVFWLARHTAFRPDEMARYAYPVKDRENLERLLAEDEALARALDSADGSNAAGWAAAALRIRRERTLQLEEDARAFEAALEMMEGTANYVARRAVNQRPAQTADRLRAKRPAEGIRWRFYETGTALCWLLDRFEPDWKSQCETRPDLTTIEILRAALARDGAKPKLFSETETAGFQNRAADEVDDLSGRQERLRRELLARPGARVIVESAEGAEPFSLERFDPINLFVLEEGEVAHPHYITLGSSSGSIALTNAGFSRGSYAGTVALSASAGRRPLGDGIRRLTIVGIEGTPLINREGTIVLTAPGVKIELRGAVLQADGETTRITVGAPKRGPEPPGG